MRTSIRIVAGSLKGRRLDFTVNPELRPTPQMVREALFSLLGNAVPDRLFVDVFSGTGVIGLEALSRGASSTYFIERDLILARDIEKYLKKFDLFGQGRIYRTDAYRWISAWMPPTEPVNVFLSPPFADLSQRSDELIQSLRLLQERMAEDSIIILQSERDAPIEEHEILADWERRTYGRNVLFIWQRAGDNGAPPNDESMPPI